MVPQKSLQKPFWDCWHRFCTNWTPLLMIRKIQCNTLNILLKDGLERRKQAVFKCWDSSGIQFTSRADDDADRLKQEMIKVRLAWILKQQRGINKMNLLTIWNNYTASGGTQTRITYSSTKTSTNRFNPLLITLRAQCYFLKTGYLPKHSTPKDSNIVYSTEGST